MMAPSEGVVGGLMKPATFMNPPQRHSAAFGRNQMEADEQFINMGLIRVPLL